MFLTRRCSLTGTGTFDINHNENQYHILRGLRSWVYPQSTHLLTQRRILTTNDRSNYKTRRNYPKGSHLIAFGRHRTRNNKFIFSLKSVNINSRDLTVHTNSRGHFLHLDERGNQSYRTSSPHRPTRLRQRLSMSLNPRDAIERQGNYLTLSGSTRDRGSNFDMRSMNNDSFTNKRNY